MEKERREQRPPQEEPSPSLEATEEAVEASAARAERPEAQLETFRKQLEEEKAKAEDYLRHWQRTQADFINYKRRVETEREEHLRFANAALIFKLLTILDDWERAALSLPSDLHPLTWIQGVFLMDRKLRAILEQEGLSPIEALGQEFNPTLHEAVLQEEVEESQQGKVIAELQKGYKLHGRTLRPTLVKVGMAKTAAPAEQEPPKEEPSGSSPE